MADEKHLCSSNSFHLCYRQTLRIQHLYLSSTLVFQLSICARLTMRYCHAFTNALMLPATLCDRANMELTVQHEQTTE